MSISAVAFAQRAVELAQLDPPIPYVLGGRTRAGTDCSNLVRLILRELGEKDVVAGSDTMWTNHVVEKLYIDDFGARNFENQLQIGDLLFMDYGEPATRNGTPGRMAHMGIYVGPRQGAYTKKDGIYTKEAGTVVHASQSNKCVCFSNIPTTFTRWTHRGKLKEVDYNDGNIGLTGEGGGAAGVGGGVVGVPVSPPAASVGPGLGQAQVITTTSGLNLRRLPGKDGAKIKEMPLGTIVDVIRVEGVWANVQWNVRPGLYHTGWCCIGEDGVAYLRFG